MSATCPKTGAPCARTCHDYDGRGTHVDVMLTATPETPVPWEFSYWCQEKVRAMSPGDRAASLVPAVIAAEADR